MKNSVYLGVSIDGYIADKNGKLDWLDIIPNPNGIDMGYSNFMSGIDAVLMGRNSFETVCGFKIEWPYDKPVFVLSNTLKTIPSQLKNKVFIVNGRVEEVLKHIHQKGFTSLYIDGGKTVQSFLKEDLIDEMILTTIPVVLGGGTALFGNLENPLLFDLVETKVFLKHIVQRHYKRNR